MKLTQGLDFLDIYFDLISILAIFFSKNNISSKVYFFDALVYFDIKKDGIYGFDVVGFINE